MKSELPYVVGIFFCLAAAIAFTLYMPVGGFVHPGDCFQDGSATIFRAKFVGKHSIYFTTDDEWNSRVILSIGEVPDRLKRIDCPETLIPCHGGQVCSLSPSHSQVSTPDTD